MNLNVAKATLARWFSRTSTDRFSWHGVEYSRTFMLGAEGTRVVVYGVDDRLSSISLTNGAYHKEYKVGSFKALLKAVDEYFEEGALISSCVH